VAAAPVIEAAASDAMNAMSSAISGGAIQRGMRLLSRAINTGSASAGMEAAAPAMSGVFTPPGQMQLTRTPDFENSTASAFVSNTAPPLDAQYAALYGWPSTPALDATVTMLPPRSSR